MPCLFGDEEVRFLVRGSEIWAVLADLARVLEYRDAEQAGRLLRAKDRGTILNGTPGVSLGMTIVSEAGIYRLIMRSNKPAAEKFQDWITDDVLPSIREHGCYPPPIRVRQRPIRKWVKKRADAHGFSSEWEQTRQRTADGNLAANRQNFAIGCDPGSSSRRYNSLYTGLFRYPASPLKDMVGCRDKDSPLDHMGIIPLSLFEAANNLVTRKVEEGFVTKENLHDDAEQTARAIRETALDRLGPDHDFGLTEDRRGRKIIDAMRQLPGTAS
jgi:prophage antirepressor-like protein